MHFRDRWEVCRSKGTANHTPWPFPCCHKNRRFLDRSRSSQRWGVRVLSPNLHSRVRLIRSHPRRSPPATPRFALLEESKSKGPSRSPPPQPHGEEVCKLMVQEAARSRRSNRFPSRPRGRCCLQPYHLLKFSSLINVTPQHVINEGCFPLTVWASQDENDHLVENTERVASLGADLAETHLITRTFSKKQVAPVSFPAKCWLVDGNQRRLQSARSWRTFVLKFNGCGTLHPAQLLRSKSWGGSSIPESRQGRRSRVEMAHRSM